ncbi:hypothetical protein [Paraglaciecola sp. L1A13]|uniref:hypothetical protein n=1 Tax=Paraglaciecola sp. L1A13 TaxID=2686359 RepID=UPI00131E5CB9|nr:hypothetical protein [Paraglaciecola sp. L1A13]|tara:strand:- start:113 stop:1315 length:1203 start_codon:yes stop_codon:yes gene_type:complete
MIRRVFHLISASCIILLSWAPAVHAEDEDKLQFSGFARVIMGYLDDKNVEYVGYDNSVSFDQQSLLGLQADYQLNEDFSFTGQLVGHTGSQRDSGLEWLYLTYKPNNSFQVKLGKQRIPFFNYSDSLDVGFAYPWLTLPQQFYDTAFFSTFEGVLANYEFSLDDWVINYEGYWGYYNDQFYSGSRTIDIKATGLYGISTTLGYKHLSLRASYNQGDVQLGFPEASQLSELLDQLGFSNNANWLNPNGPFQFYQLSANYEDLDYFVRSEAAKIAGESGLIPDVNSYYISAGYNFYPYTAYISYSVRDVKYRHIPNEIPYGVSDQLDVLAATYDLALSQFLDEKTNGSKIGIRWDWRSNVALKAEITLVRADSKVSNDSALQDLGNFDGRAVLYQLGIDWVF